MEKNRFSDHFSDVAQAYVAARPHYPQALFDWLASQCPPHSLVWDCATGNGQAAVGLATQFAQVIATDASRAQIDEATPHPSVRYSVAPADASGLPDHCADLITVAQALHWFDPDRFYAEVNRVLRPGGLLAVWTYGRVHLADSDTDRALQTFYDEITPYWPAERAHIETAYRNLPFPYPRLETPAFAMSVHWPLSRLVGYVRSWSACKAWKDQHGTDAAEVLHERLTPLWGDPAAGRDVYWPLTVLAGRAPLSA